MFTFRNSESNRNDLVTRGAIPILVTSLHSNDPDVQYYSLAALSNLAVNEKHRAMMVAMGYHDMTKRCIQLLGSNKEKVSGFAQKKTRIESVCFMSLLISEGCNKLTIQRF